jgi:hypothetical protein
LVFVTRRKPGSRCGSPWIPAFAGMTSAWTHYIGGYRRTAMISRRSAVTMRACGEASILASASRAARAWCGGQPAQLDQPRCADANDPGGPFIACLIMENGRQAEPNARRGVPFDNANRSAVAPPLAPRDSLGPSASPGLAGRHVSRSGGELLLRGLGIAGRLLLRVVTRDGGATGRTSRAERIVNRSARRRVMGLPPSVPKRCVRAQRASVTLPCQAAVFRIRNENADHAFNSRLVARLGTRHSALGTWAPATARRR